MKSLAKFFRDLSRHFRQCEASIRADRKWKERGERKPVSVNRSRRRGGGAPSNYTGD